MQGKFFLSLTIAVLLSFAGGFFLANSLNRNEINVLRSENEALKTLPTEPKKNAAEANLSDGEIRSKIVEADKNPTDIEYQKNLGTALYQYAMMKQDAELLGEAARLLKRVYESDKKDFSIVVMLGNALFDIGYLKKEDEKFAEAREMYKQALELKPNDADVRTDYGLTYFLQTPPENEKALAEFEKSYKQNPSHEKTLQVLTQFFLSRKNISEAEKYLSELRAVNKNNRNVPSLEKQLAEAKNNP